MSDDPDDVDDVGADLAYANEKIVNTVQYLAAGDEPLPERVLGAWLAEGERTFPPGDDIPQHLAAVIREVNSELRGEGGRLTPPAPLVADDLVRKLVDLAVGLNAALAASGQHYYGEDPDT